jgi:hypothetical protein
MIFRVKLKNRKSLNAVSHSVGSSWRAKYDSYMASKNNDIGFSSSASPQRLLSPTTENVILKLPCKSIHPKGINNAKFLRSYKRQSDGDRKQDVKYPKEKTSSPMYSKTSSRRSKIVKKPSYGSKKFWNKKPIDYSNYYTENMKMLAKCSSPKKLDKKCTSRVEKPKFDQFKTVSSKPAEQIKKIKWLRAHLSKSHRSCSNDKEQPIKERLFDSAVANHQKHQSPIVDRIILDELKESSWIIGEGSAMINKVYKSKNKQLYHKIATSRDFVTKVIYTAKPKQNKSTKSISINEHPEKKHMRRETAASKKSTEMQSNFSPFDTKTDASKGDSSIDNNKTWEWDFDIQQLRGQNEELIKENRYLKSLLKDYEEIKTNEGALLDRIDAAERREREYQSKIQKYVEDLDLRDDRIGKLKEEVQRIRRENIKLESDTEMKSTHLETKIRLLTEALNKRNEDIKMIEASNEELVKLLEKCDEKLIKLDEDHRLEKIRSEKYEKMLTKEDPKFEKIDIETIDGRIAFMVNILEEYRKILEDESQNESDCYEYTESEKEGKSQCSEPLIKRSFSSY